MTERMLVIGAGQAAADLVSGLIQAGHRGTITVVGAEPHPPYQRPPLSKDYLLGQCTVDDLALRARQFFTDHDVDLIPGDPVVAVWREPDGGFGARCASGRRLPADRLVLATGVTARRIPQLAEVSGVHALRTLADADALGALLTPGRRVGVIGGGFIGLEVAAAARQRDCVVTVVESAPRVLGRVVTAPVADHVTQHHRDSGIDIRTGVRVTKWGITDGAVSGMTLDDGTTVPVDLVVIGIGGQFDTTLADMLGLECRDGIVVDDAQRASDGRTLAIGDCAVGPAPGGDGTTLVRLESVDHATRSATVAVATLTGQTPPPASPPWFWSDQADVKIQVVGLTRPDDVAVIRRGKTPDQLLVAHFRDQSLVAATAVNAPGDFMGLRKALANHVTITPDEVADPDLPLSKLVAQRLRSAKNSVAAT